MVEGWVGAVGGIEGRGCGDSSRGGVAELSVFLLGDFEGPFSKVAVGAAEAEEVAEETDAQKKMAAQRRAAAKKVSSS